jgi:hypothetical protein
MVCQLHRSLYALKQSPGVWFGRFNTVVQQFDMIHSKANYSQKQTLKHTLLNTHSPIGPRHRFIN